jgi:serine/threonine protein kinase
MHKHHIAHLDISLTNLLTDYMGHYAYIDYEISRRFESSDPTTHLIYSYRGTELPPESGKDTPIDPYKVDVWALAVLILRSCKVCLPIIFIIVSCSFTLYSSRATGFPSSWILSNPCLMRILVDDLRLLPSYKHLIS